jgi:hypothetical protein
MAAQTANPAQASVGVIPCTPRIGHAAARFDPALFAQIDRMRRLLETELCRGTG